ncbi:hypothetical protein DUI87_01150 [Hirundo rustica rustica]|uniref:Uncharacterized protein n=1 Tax=Hirundo rustica rustica TaxID=333673 RepID=A0A3M0L4U5_HIRRU|nr:hypothetical protein DUI87_01150 [Hirundo rustica rustica]
MVRAFEKFSEPINLVTDSAYVVGVVSRAEQAVLKEIDNEHLFRLLSKLIYLISHREHLFYVMHVRSHTDLPGEIAEGNRQADSLAAPVKNARLPDIFQQAKLSHQQYHQNVPGLIRQFQLTQSQARAIVATCPSCQVQAMPSMGMGVNPRGLGSCEVWQTDISHIPSFGCLKYVHVSIDTHSGTVYASAHAGEKTERAKKHLVQAFSVLGIPKEIKTDNSPAYASKEFLEFVQQWGVEHKTGIPHSPTGQAVVERAHQMLKQVLARQSSTTVWMSPHEKLCKVMFTINFLNCSFENMSPPVVRHFNSGNQFKLSQLPPVMIRDPETWETKEKAYLTLNPVMNPIQVVILLLLNSLAAAWIIPQPRQNIWVTLAQSLQQENICLSTASTDNPMSTCLVALALDRSVAVDRSFALSGMEWEFPQSRLKLPGVFGKKSPALAVFVSENSFESARCFGGTLGISTPTAASALMGGDSTVKDDEPENQDTEPENQLFPSTKCKQELEMGIALNLFEPLEPLVAFVERLTPAIELQVKKEEGAQEQVLEEMALTNVNEQCKAAILSLPMELAPTLDDMLQSHHGSSPDIFPPRLGSEFVHVKIQSRGIRKFLQGPSQYATYIATIHPDNNRETVGSVANKLRNYESIISGPMQAQVSAVAKELRKKMEEVTEEIRETVWIRWPGTSEPQKYEALVDTSSQCTLIPSEYVGTEPISIAGVTGGSQELTLLEAEVSLTGKEWQKHPIVTGSGAPCILGIDFLRNGYYKDSKGLRWAFGIAAVEAEGIKKLNSLPGLSENPSAVRLLKVEEQRVPVATSTVHRRQYQTNRDAVIPIHKMIHELESQGVVSKTHSPFNSPIWPVRKPDGEWRLTVDYRALNEVTPPLSAAVPDMLELQYELESKAAKWYATIDIANAFFSIPLAAECRPQFAFTWRGVQYTWNRLPQGWKHSPTICHGLIQAALEKGEAPKHLQYIDDIIVWGNTAMEVFEKGEKIIHILLKAGFAIKQSKVKGPAREIQFLGVKWQNGRRQIPTEVINKITAMSPPTSKKETQAFLGAIGFWKMHIPEYSQIVSPLYLVTRKKNDFHWGPEQQQAFAQIKQEIAHAVALGPVRTGPDVKNVLYSAAGNNGLSWSLWQKVPGETRGRPLGFWSRSYRGSEANYTPTEKEILAAYEGVQAASEVIGTEAQLLLAPRLPVLRWMFKGKVPSTHHATDAT